MIEVAAVECRSSFITRSMNQTCQSKQPCTRLLLQSPWSSCYFDHLFINSKNILIFYQLSMLFNSQRNSMCAVRIIRLVWGLKVVLFENKISISIPISTRNWNWNPHSYSRTISHRSHRVIDQYRQCCRTNQIKSDVTLRNVATKTDYVQLIIRSAGSGSQLTQR